jgi:hypothetical protein
MFFTTLIKRLDYRPVQFLSKNLKYFYSIAPHSPSSLLSTQEFRPFKLEKTIQLSHNTRILLFQVSDVSHIPLKYS